jgi:flagellar motor protein MotB
MFRYKCGTEPFGFNSSALGEQQRKCLDDAASWLKDGNNRVIIEGHRDSAEIGGVSFDRAIHARDYLVNERGVDAGRIEVRNFCAYCLVDSNDAWRNARIDVGVIANWDKLSATSTVHACANSKEPPQCEEFPR